MAKLNVFVIIFLWYLHTYIGQPFLKRGCSTPATNKLDRNSENRFDQYELFLVISGVLDDALVNDDLLTDPKILVIWKYFH